MYCDDVFVGYRHYNSINLPVQFAFGHGLSYTTFSLADLKVRVDQHHILVNLKLTNTGHLAGSEVVQCYITQRSSSVTRPLRELKAFSKEILRAGDSVDVKIRLPTKYATSFWDESISAWVSEAGWYDVSVGNSSQSSNFLQAAFETQDTFSWNGL